MTSFDDNRAQHLANTLAHNSESARKDALRELRDLIEALTAAESVLTEGPGYQNPLTMVMNEVPRLTKVANLISTHQVLRSCEQQALWAAGVESE